VAAERIAAVNPSASVEIDDDPGIPWAIEGADFVLCCLDPGLASVIEELNRAALAQRIPWCSARASAFEGVVGPTVIPYETACYRCYRERAAACRDDPAEALAELDRPEENDEDRSRYRENLPFGAGIVGQLLALQAFQALTGLTPATRGRILVVDLLTSALGSHVVLRKPWCPDCFPPGEA
jgi:ribosomal protein S12 methylthiotransferase accessory factor